MYSVKQTRHMLLLSVLGLSLVACGDNKKEEESAPQDTSVEQTTNEEGKDTVSNAELEENGYKAENIAFLETNKDKEGVQVTESGLQYRMVEAGNGEGKRPTAADFVTVHYAGRLIDGTEFDSSYKRGEPITFPLNRVIPGWTEGLQLMTVGDKMELTIPSDLAYGDDQRPGSPIPGNSTLIFDVELLDVKTEAEVLAEQEAELAELKKPQVAYLEENAKKDGIQTTDSGLQYRVISEGTGIIPTDTSTVTVHYKGSLIDGTVFDSSYERGEPAQFPVNGVIPGWTEALQLMKVGSKWELTIPSDIAYGPRGAGQAIPPHATLVFEVELLDSKTPEEIEAEIEAQSASQKAYLEENAKKDGVIVTESGLQYRIITEGKGVQPSRTSQVTVHYRGRLIDGLEFDSSYARGEPATFPVDGVIAGWTEALQLMQEGAKWELTIPAELGYGTRGAGRDIPPNATLVFDVELISVEN
jgi:peptidylprolyl isomerase